MIRCQIGDSGTELVRDGDTVVIGVGSTFLVFSREGVFQHRRNQGETALDNPRFFPHRKIFKYGILNKALHFIAKVLNPRTFTSLFD